MPKQYLLQVLAGFHPHQIHYCISSKKLLPDRMFETFTTYKWDVLYFDSQSNFFNDACKFFRTAKFAIKYFQMCYILCNNTTYLQVSNF